MKTAAHLIQGTSALQHFESCYDARRATIQAVICEPSGPKHARVSPSTPFKRHPHPLERLHDVLDRSEMYCSLRFEDFRGCPYRMFTNEGIAAFYAVSTVIAVIAIAFGA